MMEIAINVNDVIGNIDRKQERMIKWLKDSGLIVNKFGWLLGLFL